MKLVIALLAAVSMNALQAQTAPAKKSSKPGEVSPAEPASKTRQKNPADDGPSEGEAVEFIASLLNCERKDEAEPVMAGARYAYNQIRQKSNVSWVRSGESLLSENVESLLYRGYSENGVWKTGGYIKNTIAKVGISWSRLELGAKADHRDVRVNCRVGQCVELEKVESLRFLEEVNGKHMFPNCAEFFECLQDARRKLSGLQPARESLSHYVVNFCTAADAERGAKAINHLIQIKGGKKPLF